MEHSMIMKLIKEAYQEGLSVTDKTYEEHASQLGDDADLNNKIFEKSVSKEKIEYLLRTKYSEVN